MKVKDRYTSPFPLEFWLHVRPEYRTGGTKLAAGKILAGKSFMAKPHQLPEKWWVVDASDKIVGRLASDIAMILMGKHRPTYTPHTDSGDYVIVTHCEKVKLTGRKWSQKRYTWYTGYTRQRAETAQRRLEQNPDEIIREAVRRMLPKNKLSRKILTKLKVYTGGSHPHQAQNPEPKELGIK